MTDSCNRKKARTAGDEVSSVSSPDILAANDRNHRDQNVAFSVPFVHRLRFTDDVFGQDSGVLLELLNHSSNGAPRVQFWLDQHVANAVPALTRQIDDFCDRHANRVNCMGNVQLVPGGEAIKNDIHILERMLKVMHAANLDRRSYVVVIGGGAVLDAVGFAAAIAHRGIRLIRLPTTTLAQADSGIGVKNSVNLFQKKNWLGTFAVPWGVINDAALLESLSDRDFVCGFSEAVKVALLKSTSLFHELAQVATRIRRRERQPSCKMIRLSAQLHLDHITQGGDPFEALEARPLDFGHWSAHRLETMSDFELRHGEAVAIGVAFDTVYSSLVHGLPAEAAEAVLRCLRDLGFSLYHPVLEQQEAIFSGLEEFRQHLGGRLTLTMLSDIGKSFEVHEVDRDRMREAMNRVLEYAGTGSHT